MKFTRFFIAIVLVGLSCILNAKELKVLAIGNSFSWSVDKYLPQVVKSVEGESLIMQQASLGGCSLKRHWDNAEQDKKCYTDKINGKNINSSLKDKLQAEKWDIITIQQASHDSWKVETYQPYAKNLLEMIKTYAPQAKVLIQQTWVYRFDDPRLRDWKIDTATMFDKSRSSYHQIAKELNIELIPTGDAVELARKTQKTPYQAYDLNSIKSLAYPDKLPSEVGSLVVGNSWRSKKVNGETQYSFSRDASHLNNRGRYLQACLWFGVLYNRPVSDIKFYPKELELEDALFLQNCAQKAIDNLNNTKNKGE